MDFLRYWHRLLVVFPLVGLAIVAKEPIVDGRISELTRLALVSAVRCFSLRNFLQPNIWWGLRYSKYFLFLHGYGVDEGEIGGRLVASL